jgi:hypothetical protein
VPPPNRNAPGHYHFHCYDYGGAAPWQLSPGQPARNGWQFYSMAQDLQGLFNYAGVVPNLALHNLGQSAADGANRNIWSLSFGGPVPLAPATPRVVITGGIHAREWIATEMAYLIAEYLLRNYVIAHAAPPGTVNQQTLMGLINSRHIHIIPMVNPHGNFYTVVSPDQGARMWRRNRRPMPTADAGWQAALTNANPPAANQPFRNVQLTANDCRYEVPQYDVAQQVPPNPATYSAPTVLPNNTVGVDLNRNFHTPAWGYATPFQYAEGVPGTDPYFGPEVASEIETRQVENFFANNLPAGGTSVDYHSYAEQVLYPTEAFDQGIVANTVGYQATGQQVQALIQPNFAVLPGVVSYGLGSPRQRLGVDALGCLFNYLALTVANRMQAFAIELDPNGNQGLEGFDLDENLIQGVFEKNIRGTLALIAAAGAGANVAAAAAPYAAWNVFGLGNTIP